MTCPSKQLSLIFLIIIFLQSCHSNNESQTIGMKSIPYKVKYVTINHVKDKNTCVGMTEMTG